MVYMTEVLSLCFRTGVCSLHLGVWRWLLFCWRCDTATLKARRIQGSSSRLIAILKEVSRYRCCSTWIVLILLLFQHVKAEK